MASGSDYLEDFANLRLNETKDINILLLGESGVGKSTFINSIANYLTFNSLKKAVRSDDIFVLIPSQITVTDRHRQPITVNIGKCIDQNEYQEIGVSATQDVKTYVFPIGEHGKTKLRLIDTPGMGDGRGVQQDQQNCENILNYLQQLHELHAICILLKSGIARISVEFEYCIKQILSCLDKSASRNLIFIFTHTRASNYDGGETFPCLEKLIKNIKKQPPHVEIPLGENVFSFDNEGFRYLAGSKRGVEFDDDYKDDCKKSWKKSARECWRLISYIVGDTTRSPLKPHQLSNTISINEARKLIFQLSQPLAEITQLISDNLYALQRHRYQLRIENQSLDELKTKLYIPVVDLEITKLTQPATVCGSSKCAEIYKIGELNKWHYKQRCHDPCYLINVAAEMIGDPGLRNCAAMNGSEKCGKCGCNFSIHMHIYYMSKTTNKKIVDNIVQNNIQSKQGALNEAAKLIQDIDKKRSELEDERERITSATALFAHFLQNNAITPFNDSYKDYIQHLITREQSLGVAADPYTIYELKKLERQYDEMKQAFDRSLTGNAGSGSTNTKDVLETIKKLYGLKHTGSKIREMLDKQKSSRKKEFERTEYVHKSSSKPPTFAEKKVSDTKQKQSANTTTSTTATKNYPPPPPYTRFPPKHNRPFNRNQAPDCARRRQQNNEPSSFVRVEVLQQPPQPHPNYGSNFGQQNYTQQPPPYQQNYPPYQNFPPYYQMHPPQQNFAPASFNQMPVSQQNYPQYGVNYGGAPLQHQQYKQQQQGQRGGYRGRPKQGGFKKRNKSRPRRNQNKPNQTSEDNYDSSSSSSF